MTANGKQIVRQEVTLGRLTSVLLKMVECHISSITIFSLILMSIESRLSLELIMRKFRVF